MNILIGLGTGCLSGWAITNYYRKKDEERDRQQFFFEVRQYLLRLVNLNFSNPKEIIEFLLVNDFPPIYSWVKISDDEGNVILDLYKKIEMIQYIAKDCIILQEKARDEFTAELGNEIAGKLENLWKLNGEIVEMLPEIKALGKNERL